MRSILDHKLELILSITLLAVNVILFNLLADRTRVFRLDLTEGSLYTLSDTTVEILENLEEPVTITFFYSSREAQHDWIRPLVDPLKDILAEFKAEGGDHVAVEFQELDTAGEKARTEAANRYGVRPFAVPVKTTFESGVKDTYFSVVIEANGGFEEKNLGANFTELCRFVETGGSKQDGRLELADIEYLVAKTIHNLSRSFSSVSGALAAHDQRAKVTILLSEKSKLPKDLEDLKETATKVTKEMGRKSGGRLETVFKSPLAKAKTRDEVVEAARAVDKAYGARPYARRGEEADEYYYASMVVEIGGQKEVQELAGRGKPGENEIRELPEGMIKPLIPGFLPVVGLSVPAPPPPNPMMQRMGQPPPQSQFGMLERYLSTDYQVETVNLGGETPAIPRKIEVLVLVRPADLSEKAAFAIDQFVMRGGRLVVLADRHHADMSKGQFSEPLAVGTWGDKNLLDILAHWGAEVQAGVIQDTRASGVVIQVARTISGMQFRESVPIRYPMALTFGDEGLAREHPVTGSVALIEFFWASPIITEKCPDGVTATTLMETSKESSTLSVVPGVNTVIEKEYAAPEDARSYTVMVCLQGSFPSFFADKPIPGLDEPSTGEPLPFSGAPLKKSRATTVTVISDADFISPDVMRMVGRDSETFGEHLKLLKNAVDFGGPDSVILSIRNRAPAVRTLTEFAGMKPEERKDSGIMASWVTTLVSCGLVLVLAGAWFMLRRRRPLDLPESPGGAS